MSFSRLKQHWRDRWFLGFGVFMVLGSSAGSKNFGQIEDRMVFRFSGFQVLWAHRTLQGRIAIGSFHCFMKFSKLNDLWCRLVFRFLGFSLSSVAQRTLQGILVFGVIGFSWFYEVQQA